MRGLVHSGGGRKGAWGVGVLKALTSRLKLDWPVLCGTSVGAINLSKIAMSPMGSAEDAVEELEDMWLDLRTQDVWRHWFLGPLASLWRESFYNSKPLWVVLESELCEEAILKSGRTLKVGCVDYRSGKYFEADPDLAVRNHVPWWKYVAASSSYPGALLPVALPEGLCGDGGAISATPLKAAIDAGCNTIDVILTAPMNPKPMSLEDNRLGTKFNAIDITLRTVDLLAHEAMVHDVRLCQEINTLVRQGRDEKHREIQIHLYCPEKSLTSSPLDALNFDPKRTAELIKLGEKDALSYRPMGQT